MIENLKTLVALKRHQTMTKTSTALRVGQSTVSKRIAQLEFELGVQLIFKQGRNVELTLEGKKIADKARSLLAEIVDLKELADKREEFISIRLGISDSLLSSWIPKCLKAVNQKIQQAKLEVHSHRSPGIVDRVSSGEYALGLCSIKNDHHPTLVIKNLGMEPFVLYNHRIDSNELLAIEEHSESWKSIAQATAEKKLIPTARMESFTSIAQYARHFQIKALFPLGLARTLKLPQKDYKILKIKRPIVLIGRKSTFLRQEYQGLIELLERQTQNHLNKLYISSVFQ